MKSDKMGSVMMSSVKYKGIYQFDPIKGMPAGHMKNEQFFIIADLILKRRPKIDIHSPNKTHTDQVEEFRRVSSIEQW
ncbi:hypothetical protein P5673_010585 [Acropora cervicornis]|uniref:Uncharacterized protein n=1 Tax=Acropora cervicornis TaxID=6130 RepID=A0AAD9V945_ACRCE|nr:hypothetical protein P5673_010585 [Acropora cervicornis]